jgi:hypothetical protein
MFYTDLKTVLGRRSPVLFEADAGSSVGSGAQALAIAARAMVGKTDRRKKPRGLELLRDSLVLTPLTKLLWRRANAVKSNHFVNLENEVGKNQGAIQYECATSPTITTFATTSYIILVRKASTVTFTRT